eukprot:TRINITY_DN4340_c0_g1_i1.p1 TRINITY_DN4340_c0_g1~~TRINITY_DN4340_c0_g1_i1.p1  ORF type:complete len:241 (-),score=68.70 TRINITY_DN4340_c0_g1_i1:35-757(-)
MNMSSSEPIHSFLTGSEEVTGEFCHLLTRVVELEPIRRDFIVYYENTMNSFENLFWLNLHINNRSELAAQLRRRSTFRPALKESEDAEGHQIDREFTKKMKLNEEKENAGVIRTVTLPSDMKSTQETRQSGFFQRIASLPTKQGRPSVDPLNKKTLEELLSLASKDSFGRRAAAGSNQRTDDAEEEKFFSIQDEQIIQDSSSNYQITPHSSNESSNNDSYEFRYEAVSYTHLTLPTIYSV